MVARTSARNADTRNRQPIWWVVGAIAAVGVASAAAAWLKNARDPPELGAADGVSASTVFLGTLSLAVGTGLGVALFRRRADSRRGYLLALAAVGCVGFGLLTSGYVVDRATDSRVNDVLGTLNPSEGVVDIERLPDYTEPYYATPADSLGERFDRMLDTYLGQFGAPLALTALLIGGGVGWLVGPKLPRRAKQPRAEKRASLPLKKVGTLDVRTTVNEVAFARVAGKNVLVARTRRGALVVDVDGGRRITDRELTDLIGLPAGSSAQDVRARLRSARVGEPFHERSDWWGAARCGTLIARPAGTAVEVWRATSSEARGDASFWESKS